eukprot:gene1902-21710_t
MPARPPRRLAMNDVTRNTCQHCGADPFEDRRDASRAAPVAGPRRRPAAGLLGRDAAREGGTASLGSFDAALAHPAAR